MAEEQLVSILTLDVRRIASRGHSIWTGLNAFARDLMREAQDSDYHIFPYSVGQELSEWDRMSRIDRDAVGLLWSRMPPCEREFRRLYVAFLGGPLDATVGDALCRELNPLNLSPIDDSRAGARVPISEIRMFRLIRRLWDCPEVADGIFAAFTWELSWPHLEERRCSLDEMLGSLYHWFDRDGRWKDKTYYVGK